MDKRIRFVLIAAVALFVTAYIASPYLALRNLKSAAASSDVDALEAAVDFPAVQSSLKSQLTVALTEQMQDDPALRDNPFSGLAMVMMPAIIDKAVSAYVTPEGIAALTNGSKPNQDATEVRDVDVDYKTEYSGINRFRVKISNTKTQEEGPSLLLERRGIFSWKMIKVELPGTFLKRSEEAAVE